MSRNRTQEHRQHQYFAQETYVPKVLGVAMLLASAALVASLADEAKLAYRSLPFAPCRLNDDASVAEYKHKIESAFNSRGLDKPISLPITPDDSKPELKMIGISKSDSTEFGPSIRVRTSDALSRISPKLIEASGVETVRIQNIKKDFDLPNRGLFGLSLPHSIVIDYPNLEDTIRSVLEGEDNYDRNQATLSGDIIHEMGHAATAEYCYTSDPPKEFIDAIDHFEPYTGSFPETETYYAEGSVSAYAAEKGPAEDIAETIQAIMGTAWYDPRVNTLQFGLNDDNPIMQEKVAVTLAMLDKLEPGLGEDALTKMKASRNELMINGSLDHLIEPRG
jgi:hypothetical protein